MVEQAVRCRRLVARQRVQCVCAEADRFERMRKSGSFCLSLFLAGFVLFPKAESDRKGDDNRQSHTGLHLGPPRGAIVSRTTLLTESYRAGRIARRVFSRERKPCQIPVCFTRETSRFRRRCPLAAS